MKKNEIRKEYNFFGKKINCLLVYPDTYKIGMSNLAFLNIYRLLNENPFTSCERLFLDTDKTNSLETSKPVWNFDIIFFTISYENNIQGITKFFNNNNLNFQKEKRTNKNNPLFIVGGQFIKLYPDLLKDNFDIVFNGDFEFFFDMVISYFDKENYYVKEFFFDYIKSQIIKLPNKYLYSNEICSFSNLATDNTVFNNTFLIELTRGCPNTCNFCISGKDSPYYRMIDYEKLMKIFAELKAYNINKFGFIGLAVLRYKYFKKLCEYGIENNFSFNFSSLEISELNEEKIQLLKYVNQKTFTLAPENFSKKILKILNKQIDIDTLPNKIVLLNKYKINNLKLYMMYGIEEEEIADLDFNVEAIKEISRLYNGKITLSFNHLIPQPGTYFSLRKILPKKMLKEKKKYLLKNLRNIKNIKINFLSNRIGQIGGTVLTLNT
jgi:radical SAM superfamily enzyme YgiQ (UPF0313 family)